MIKLLATLRSASCFSSAEMPSSLATRWSSNWFLLLFRLFLRLSLPVRPASSSSWRSSSDRSSSSTSPGRRDSASLLSSTILSSSSPFAGRRVDTDLARGERWRLFEALAGLMRLLLRRRWPEGVTESISMSLRPRPTLEDGELALVQGSATSAAETGEGSAPLVTAVACPDVEMLSERETWSLGRAGSRCASGLSGEGGGSGSGTLDGKAVGMV